MTSEIILYFLKKMRLHNVSNHKIFYQMPKAMKNIQKNLKEGKNYLCHLVESKEIVTAVYQILFHYAFLAYIHSPCCVHCSYYTFQNTLSCKMVEEFSYILI